MAIEQNEWNNDGKGIPPRPENKMPEWTDVKAPPMPKPEPIGKAPSQEDIED